MSHANLMSLDGIVERGVTVHPILEEHDYGIIYTSIITRPTRVHAIVDISDRRYGICWFPKPIRGFIGFRVLIDNVTNVHTTTITFTPTP